MEQRVRPAVPTALRASSIGSPNLPRSAASLSSLIPSVLGPIALILGSCAPATRAELSPEAGLRAASAADRSHVPGQVLVKVDAEAMQALDRAIADGTFPKTGLDSLDAALAAAGASSAELVFRDSPEAFERLKADPARAARIPEGAEPPELSGLYTITLSPDASVDTAVQALSELPHVRYAQPNYYVSTSDEAEATP